MKFQRGISLNSLMVGGVVIAVLAMAAMKVAPEWIEYGNVVKAVKSTASDSGLKDATVAQVRAAYQKKQEMNDIKNMPPADLEITKDGGELVISFAYQRKVHLFSNVSVVFDFEGSSKQK